MDSGTQHDPGYERRKAEFKRQYIKKRRRQRLIHNSIVIAIRLMIVVIVLLIGFKLIDRFLLPFTETTKSQEVNKSEAKWKMEPVEQTTEKPKSVPMISEKQMELTDIVNSDNPLENGYQPNVEECYHGIFVDQRMAADLKSLVEAGTAEGLELYVVSAYRTEERQTQLYEAKADEEAAGTSEHQSGLAVDLSSGKNMEVGEAFAETATYAWLKEHCAEFGFILRYPSNKEEVTKHTFEPNHFRYVGKEAAQSIMEEKKTLEEYNQ